MELEAIKQTVCPSCNEYILPGDTIMPYDGRWFHQYCSFTRDLGTHRVSPAKELVQKRNERIRKYHRIHGWMSVRELAEYLGYSKSTVHRVLAQQ